jgi:hypothetical protein
MRLAACSLSSCQLPWGVRSCSSLASCMHDLASANSSPHVVHKPYHSQAETSSRLVVDDPNPGCELAWRVQDSPVAIAGTRAILGPPTSLERIAPRQWSGDSATHTQWVWPSMRLSGRSEASCMKHTGKPAQHISTSPGCQSTTRHRGQDQGNTRQQSSSHNQRIHSTCDTPISLAVIDVLRRAASGVPQLLPRPSVIRSSNQTSCSSGTLSYLGILRQVNFHSFCSFPFCLSWFKVCRGWS